MWTTSPLWSMQALSEDVAYDGGERDFRLFSSLGDGSTPSLGSFFHVASSNFGLTDDVPFSSSPDRSSIASSFCASLLLAIDAVMFLALYPEVVSQAPQHFRSSEMQAA